MAPKVTAFVSTNTSKNQALSVRGGSNPGSPSSLNFANEFAGLASDIFTAAATASVGDCLAQYVEQRRVKKNSQDDNEWSPSVNSVPSSFINDYDARRTGAYAVFNGVYSGGFQHFLFAGLSDRVPNPISRLILNQGFIIPFIYYPLLIWLVPKLRARTVPEKIKLRQNINVRQMVPKNWAFWVPLQFIQFNFIPTRYQVTYCAVVGFVWKFLLSFLTAGKVQTQTSAKTVAPRPVPAIVTPVRVTEGVGQPADDRSQLTRTVRGILLNFSTRNLLAEATV
jgi:hypothetical protein